MSDGRKIRDFLTARRARITPDQAGLRAYGRRRRVTGLRREEVAMLAEISVEYYTQLERGTVRGVSDEVLDAIARALQLDDVEKTHLFHLVHAAKQRPSGRRVTQEIRPSVQRVLDCITDAAAFVRNGHLDILATNRLGAALYADALSNPKRKPNLARFVFLNPRSQHFYVDWARLADDAVGSLRAEAGRDPYDRDLADLIDDLSTHSDEFRIRWAEHGVSQYRAGIQEFSHPLAGRLTLRYEAFALAADVGLTLLVYAAEPESPSQAALDRL